MYKYVDWKKEERWEKREAVYDMIQKIVRIYMWELMRIKIIRVSIIMIISVIIYRSLTCQW